VSEQDAKVSRELLKKYDRPGPRYTSYPTAPEWSADFGPAEYEAALDLVAADDAPLSLYFHIPFCKERCRYCGCTTVITQNADRVERYIGQLDRELELVAAHFPTRKRVTQLHWGGGTPTHLTCPQIERLFGAIAARFAIDPAGEIAIEVDPRVTSEEQLRLLRRLGFNRISLGVQDLTPNVQEAIGRNQTAEETTRLFNLSRAVGFTGINVDLIYGLPYQTVENFAATIADIVRLGADRVAVYSFAYLPDIRPHQRAILPAWLPSAERKYDLFATAVETFQEAGYIQIGMDHFAKPTDELARAVKEGRLYRNFMGYTTRSTRDSLGFGMSAIGELAHTFAQNVSKIDAYGAAIEAGRPATYRGRRLSLDDRIRQQAILSLMCNFTLRFDDLDARFAINSRDYFAPETGQLQTFVDDGLLAVDTDGGTVQPQGRIFVRNVAMMFDAYLRKSGREGGPVFSRTI
jgi:oxygen-independent coproporphyrinogen-3 oxidase